MLALAAIHKVTAYGSTSLQKYFFFFLDNATKFVNPWLRNYYINIKDIILTG